LIGRIAEGVGLSETAEKLSGICYIDLRLCESRVKLLADFLELSGFGPALIQISRPF
jgi:hypothetical protein